MRRIIAVLIIVVVSSAGIAWAFSWSSPYDLYNSHSWDYSPSWMADTVSGYDRLWWCSDNAGDPYGDVIKYKQGTGTDQTVLMPSGGWEGNCVCDPAVVRGSFSYGGFTWQMALYYTAAPNCGSDNKIGVAFSNDGVNWVRYSGNPIIKSAANNCQDPSQVCPGISYGAGQAQLHNWNGGSGIRIWYTDTNGPQGFGIYERVSNDGINFGSPAKITADGLGTYGLGGGVGMAFKPIDAAYLFTLRGDSDASKIGLFRIPTANRFTGTWTKLGDILPPGGDYPDTFEPGFRTDIYGNLSSTTYPSIFAGFGTGKYVHGWDPANWKLMQSGGCCGDE